MNVRDLGLKGERLYGRIVSECQEIFHQSYVYRDRRQDIALEMERN